MVEKHLPKSWHQNRKRHIRTMPRYLRNADMYIMLHFIYKQSEFTSIGSLKSGAIQTVSDVDTSPECPISSFFCISRRNHLKSRNTEKYYCVLQNSKLNAYRFGSLRCFQHLNGPSMVMPLIEVLDSSTVFLKLNLMRHRPFFQTMEMHKEPG